MAANSAAPNIFSKNAPVTGAWQQGDPQGSRQFFEPADRRKFALESGEVLENFTLAYETWGTLNSNKSNAILVCHALTGDSHAAGCMTDGHTTSGWWNDVIGPGKAIDTDNFFVVCSNVLGGCQGSTGPSSINPVTQRHYGAQFPVLTIRDMVRAQEKLANNLGIEQWHSVIGGSMGGMQVLEWSILFPHRVKTAVSIASACSASPWQIAFSAIGRRIIALDPNWNGGDYYEPANREPADGEPVERESATGLGPHAGLAIARAAGMISYRTDQVMEARFARDLVNPYLLYGPWDRFRIESYLDYQGDKLTYRFDANSYIVLNKAMDLHDIGRRPGNLKWAVPRIKMPVLCVSISSDLLYPPRQQEEMTQMINVNGGDCQLVSIDSPFGHDGFLLETEKIGLAIGEFLSKF